MKGLCLLPQINIKLRLDQFRCCSTYEHGFRIDDFIHLNFKLDKIIETREAFTRTHLEIRKLERGFNYAWLLAHLNNVNSYHHIQPSYWNRLLRSYIWASIDYLINSRVHYLFVTYLRMEICCKLQFYFMIFLFSCMNNLLFVCWIFCN